MGEETWGDQEQRGTISQLRQPRLGFATFPPGLGHGSGPTNIRSGCGQNSSIDITLQVQALLYSRPDVRGEP